uniref:CaMBD domain-containing protein n=1 Tax=Globodera pallida TaxID=36090 RepID=A0A183BTN0_GLOPA
MSPSTVGVESSGHRLVRDMSMDVQSPVMESSSGGSFFGGQLQRPQSRSPSASSLNAYGSRHSSPNPSPPPTGQQQQKGMSPRSPNSIGGAASVARMMSALLKQQNSIAEEEDSLLLVEDDDAADVEIGQTATNASSIEARLNCPNGTPSQIGTPPIGGAVDQPKNWLAPPLDFVLLGGSISPLSVRMHPITDHELRREFHPHDGGVQLVDPAAARSVLPCTSSQMGTVTESVVKQHKYHHNHHRHHHHPGTNEEKFHRQQSQPTWTRGIGANSKHRKGSLSPNNSLRYSTLMAAARRNHFQQQRTTSEATPAQRDLLMADMLGHGIRDKFCCASISAPSPQLSQECNEGGGDSIVSSSKVLARFEVGADDSSASSLNNHASSSANATPCSQCSSANSLLHFQHCCVGSIKHKQHQQAAQRSCTATDDSGGKAESGSGSLPKLVALVPSAFPPSSVMLSSNSNEQLTTTNSSGGGGTSQQASTAGVGTKKRRKSRANTSTQQQQHQQTPVGKQCQDKTQPANLLLFPPDQQRYMSGNSAIATGSSTEGGAAAVLRRDPARWNLAATKQRSSSETTFINMVSSTHVADDASSVVAQHQCSCCNMCKSTSAGGSHRCVHVPYVHVEPVPSGFTSVRAVSLGMASAGAPPSSGDRTVSGGKPHCPLARACNGTLRRPDSLSALGRPGHKHCAAIAMLNSNSVFMQNNAQREQAILQRILGPTGLGWLKQQPRLESDPLLKKSLSLVLTDDVEAQRTGAVSAAPGGTAGCGNAPSEKGGAHGSLLNNDGVSACSAKQSLVKDKERGGRFIKRQQLFSKRRVTSDYALFFAIFGIVLMIIENEFVYAEYTSVCVLLKLVILLSTICLVGLVVKFHVHEIQIFMNANSAEDWQIALTCRKSMQIVVEIIACAICPLPIKLDVFVSTVNSDGHTVPMRMPLDVLFSILMFFRLYWLCRVMLLHSRLFTDAASRSIAGLNRVKTDAKFILKTLMTICPGTMLLLFTASLWMIGGYILRLCERHHEQHDGASLLHNNMQANKHQSYLNSLWLIAVTFLSIGYGDIVPNTQCGRIMAVVTGILGTCTSSMVVAVIARKLELTRAEKHVHNFMIETQHTKQLKHIAANVLRETWLIYKHRCLVDKIEPRKIRHHQRKFLVAICALRKLKTSQRKLDENRISLGDVAKTTSHSHDLMREVHSTQEGLALRITAVEHQLSDIQREVSSIADMLRCALRPSPGPVEHPHQQQMIELCPVRQRRKPSMIGDA